MNKSKILFAQTLPEFFKKERKSTALDVLNDVYQFSRLIFWGVEELEKGKNTRVYFEKKNFKKIKYVKMQVDAPVLLMQLYKAHHPSQFAFVILSVLFSIQGEELFCK